MEVKKGLSMKKKNKKQPYHMKHDYQRFQSTDGYKFWAKNKEDAQVKAFKEYEHDWDPKPQVDKDSIRVYEF